LRKKIKEIPDEPTIKMGTNIGEPTMKKQLAKIATLLTLLCTAVFAQEKGSFKDARDGKTYKTVKIGSQTWMAENLTYQAEGGSGLYDWATAIKACPDGWHLPSEEEWKALIDFAGGEIAGRKLKAKNGWEKWDCENTTMDDRGRTIKVSKCNSDNYGFSALPKTNNGDAGAWWTASNYCLVTGGTAVAMFMRHNFENVLQSTYDQSKAFNVRCIKGAEKLPSIVPGPSVHYNGETYETVIIGSQTWFKRNLNYDVKGSKCYNNDRENCEKYGRLYDWATAMKVCPSGWHLPSDADWDKLLYYVDGKSSTNSHYTSKTAGRYLKATSGWSGDGNGQDIYGFAALPGGGTYDGKFGSVGYGGGWWTASEDGNKFVFRRGMSCSSIVGSEIQKKSDLSSVRCFKSEAKPYEEKADIPKNGVLTESQIANLMKDPSFVKDIEKVLENVKNIQTSDKDKKDILPSNDGYDELADEPWQKNKVSLKAPSAREIDTDSSDARSKAEIMAVVNASMPGVENLYNKYLRLKPGFAGKVILKFTIVPSGDIVSINIVSSTTGYSEFDNAVKNFVATWKWKTIKSGITTPTITFNFSE